MYHPNQVNWNGMHRHAIWFHIQNTRRTKMKDYVPPAVEVIASFKEATNGVWFGNHVDVGGAKAPFPWGSN